MKMIKMEDDQNGRRPKWKTTKMEDNQTYIVVVIELEIIIKH